MGAPVRVLCLALGDGLHGGREQSAAHAVAAAVGRRGDSGPALPGRGGRAEGFGGEAFGVGFGVGAVELIWCGQTLERGGGLVGLPGRFRRGISREFRSDGTPEDLRGRHAVTGVRAAALFQQQQLELLAGGAGLLCVAVDGPGDSLRPWRGHGGGGAPSRDGGARRGAGRGAPRRGVEAVFHNQLGGVLPA